MTTDLSTHPLVQHYLTILRDRQTTASEFRRCCKGMTEVIMVEAAKLLCLDPVQVETPLETTDGARLSAGVVFVPILRAGLGMLDPAMGIIPGSSVGYIGLERDETTAEASCYYAKMPDLSASSQVFVLDPMLATGGSAAQCVEQIKAHGARRVNMVCIIAAPEGIAAFEAAHPDVPIVAGKIDRELNAQRYILPGLGDFGDRLFNT
ncbi:uracil phosphoribosyltransferase [Coraliomargarita sp. SDUM461004]|uniref:Uracil phosphoribosyltransferase n=1 Tax=Thalassobacterium sedimentorum TaxID=3041258 RepID=A0ABU1AFJ2_9BACT|nr:uracil phosphoribosyltransferase [Coraliomargarita sp. SDUM461004]MDQ8193561.1 uracil phosphoribosyltransferase [Coraliomargarita sp. SDUM461004]